MSGQHNSEGADGKELVNTTEKQNGHKSSEKLSHIDTGTSKL